MEAVSRIGMLCRGTRLSSQTQSPLSEAPARIFWSLHGTSCVASLLLYSVHTDKDSPPTATCAPSENASAPFRSSCSALERLRFRVSLCLSHRHFLQYVCRQENLLWCNALPPERLQCFSRHGGQIPRSD